MVENKKLSIIWDKVAKAQLKKAYKRIKEESLQGAETVKNGILESVEKIPEQPQRYSLDKLKKDNPGNYRAFEITIIE